MEPYLMKLNVGDFVITSVVIDEKDFDTFCDELTGLMNIKDNQRADNEQILKIKKLGYLPLMSRGTKTERFFQKWKVDTDKMSVVRRGTFSKIIDQMGFRAELN